MELEDDRFYRLPEFEHWTGLSHSTAYRLFARGELPAFKIGRCVGVFGRDLRNFLATRQKATFRKPTEAAR